MADTEQMPPRRIDFTIYMTDNLHGTLIDAAAHPESPRDLSAIVRAAVRSCYPAVFDRFVSGKLDQGRKPRVFKVAPQDKFNVVRLAKARQLASKRGDVRGLDEKSNSDVVCECLRRYLVQFKDAWGLTSDRHIKAINLTAPAWPTIDLVNLFDEHVVPADIFRMLRRMYERSEAPSTVPELLRLARVSISPDANAVVSVPDQTVAEAAIAVMKANAHEWRLVDTV